MATVYKVKNEKNSVEIDQVLFRKVEIIFSSVCLYWGSIHFHWSSENEFLIRTLRSQLLAKCLFFDLECAFQQNGNIK